MKVFLRTVFILLFAVSCTFADTWSKAELYYMDWNVLARCQLSSEWLRKQADLKLNISDQAQLSKLITLLDLEKLRKQATMETEDVRFVVDLYTDTGARITYYASQFSLCNADSTYKRSISKKFKESVSQLMKRANNVVQPMR